MLIVILVIGFLLCLIANRCNDIDIGEIVAGMGLLILIVTICSLVVIMLCYPRNIDKKIQMYSEENQNIEIKVKETVRAYMNYEQNTYDNLVKDADITTLLIAYPELNSSQLIKEEIDLYIKNNNKIKELKEEQIGKSNYNWWLYFGK